MLLVICMTPQLFPFLKKAKTTKKDAQKLWKNENILSFCCWNVALVPDALTNEDIFLCNSCSSSSVPHFKRDVLHLVSSAKSGSCNQDDNGYINFQRGCVFWSKPYRNYDTYGWKEGSWFARSVLHLLFKEAFLRQVAMGSHILIRD